MHKDRIYELVLLERARQDAKWGVQNHTPVEWISILGVEFGEACQGANKLYFGHTSPDSYIEELIHTIAVAFEMLEAIGASNVE